MERARSRYRVYTFGSNTAAETREVASRIARHLRPGMIIALVGELGSGKTEFVRGIVETYTSEEQVSSPSYTLQHVYRVAAVERGDCSDAIREIHHWDLYRAVDGDVLLSLREILASTDTIALVEWADRVPELIETATVVVCVAANPDPTSSKWDSPPRVSAALEMERRSIRVEDRFGLELAGE